MIEDAITVAAPGATIATSAASASVAIPNASNGARPRWVRIASTLDAWVRLGIGAPTAAAGDLIVNPASPVLLNVNGFTHVAALQVAAAGTVVITPLDD